MEGGENWTRAGGIGGGQERSDSSTEKRSDKTNNIQCRLSSRNSFSSPLRSSLLTTLSALTSLLAQAGEQANCYGRKDWREGLDAVMEKREPEFDEWFSE